VFYITWKEGNEEEESWRRRRLGRQRDHAGVLALIGLSVIIVMFPKPDTKCVLYHFDSFAFLRCNTVLWRCLYDINLGKRGMKKRRVGEEGGWGDNVIMRGFWP
jgi:hypothetical protein